MKKLLALFLTGLILVFSLSACTETSENTRNSTVEKTEAKISSSENKEENNSASKSENIIDLSKINYSAVVMMDYLCSSNIAAMASVSDLIVRGKIKTEGFNENLELYRGFRFEIIETLKGEVSESEFRVVQVYYDVEEVSGPYSEGFFGTAFFISSFYTELEAEKEYVLFLKKHNLGYIGSTNPSIIKIEDNKAELQLGELLKNGFSRQKVVTDKNKVVEYTFLSTQYNDTISGMSLDEIKAQIK